MCLIAVIIKAMREMNLCNINANFKGCENLLESYFCDQIYALEINFWFVSIMSALRKMGCSFIAAVCEENPLQWQET